MIRQQASDSRILFCISTILSWNPKIPYPIKNSATNDAFEFFGKIRVSLRQIHPPMGMAPRGEISRHCRVPLHLQPSWHPPGSVNGTVLRAVARDMAFAPASPARLQEEHSTPRAPKYAGNVCLHLAEDRSGSKQLADILKSPEDFARRGSANSEFSRLGGSWAGQGRLIKARSAFLWAQGFSISVGIPGVVQKGLPVQIIMSEVVEDHFEFAVVVKNGSEDIFKTFQITGQTHGTRKNGPFCVHLLRSSRKKGSRDGLRLLSDIVSRPDDFVRRVLRENDFPNFEGKGFGNVVGEGSIPFNPIPLYPQSLWINNVTDSGWAVTGGPSGLRPDGVFEFMLRFSKKMESA